MAKLIQFLTKKYARLYEVFKFCVSGGITTIVDMAVMAFVIFLFDTDVNLLELIMARAKSVYAVVLGTSLGFIISWVISYILSVSYVFKAISGSFARSRKGALRYLAISLAGFAMHTGGMYVGFGIFGVNEWLVKVGLTLFVMLFSYTARKALIFKRPKGQELLKDNTQLI